MSPVWDYDVWFQLACGRAIVALRGLPSHDLFSFTAADRAWDTQEWLSQLMLYGVWRIGGLPLLTVGKAGCAAWLCAVLYRDAVRGETMAGRWIAVGVCTWGAYVMRWHLVERPQVLSMLFLALELAWLRSHGRRWPIVPLTLVWANVHGGSALLGPGIFGMWLMAEAVAAGRRPTSSNLAVLGVSIVAIAGNPAGWHLFTYPLLTLRDPMYMANILEWTPPTWGEAPEFFLLLGVATLAGGASWRMWSLSDGVVGIVLTGLALTARRHIPLAVIALAPPVIHALTVSMRSLPGRWRADRWVPGVALAGAITCLTLAGTRGEALRLGTRDDLYPASAITSLHALESAFRGAGSVRVFALHRWGGYLIWHLPERFKMFIDGRQMVYGRQIFQDYLRIQTDIEQTGVLLDRYAPDVLVVEHDSGVTRRLAQSSAHVLVHWDDTCRMYLRRAAFSPGWVAAHAYRAATPDPRPGAAPGMVLTDLARAARESPRDARPWLIRADFLLALGRTDAASFAAQEAVQRRPVAVPALLAASRIAAIRGDHAGADAFARRAERADPGGAAPQLAFARLALARNNSVEADARITVAIRRGSARERQLHRPEPELTASWQLQAEVSEQTGRRESAAAAWRETGNRWYRDARYAEALRCYESGLRVAPADGRLLHNRAAALGGLGRTREARAAWKRVLEVNPHDPEAMQVLGENHLR